MGVPVPSGAAGIRLPAVAPCPAPSYGACRALRLCVGLVAAGCTGKGAAWGRGAGCRLPHPGRCWCSCGWLMPLPVLLPARVPLLSGVPDLGSLASSPAALRVSAVESLLAPLAGLPRAPFDGFLVGHAGCDPGVGDGVGVAAPGGDAVAGPAPAGVAGCGLGGRGRGAGRLVPVRSVGAGGRGADGGGGVTLARSFRALSPGHAGARGAVAGPSARGPGVGVRASAPAGDGSVPVAARLDLGCVPGAALAARRRGARRWGWRAWRWSARSGPGG